MYVNDRTPCPCQAPAPAVTIRDLELGRAGLLPGPGNPPEAGPSVSPALRPTSPPPSCPSGLGEVPWSRAMPVPAACTSSVPLPRLLAQAGQVGSGGVE